MMMRPAARCPARQWSPAAVVVLALAAGTVRADADPATGRWYSVSQVARGQEVFATHCAACHGDRGQGQPGWEERDESGYYPPPPLDGGGHSAHHPLPEMLRILDTGGAPMGGTMPSFSDVLDDADKHAVIAWFQSLWDPATFSTWSQLPAE